MCVGRADGCVGSERVELHRCQCCPSATQSVSQLFANCCDLGKVTEMPKVGKRREICAVVCYCMLCD